MIRYLYIRDKKNFPMGCVSFELVGDVIEYACSTYNPHDIFDRHEARRIADARRVKHPARVQNTVPLDDKGRLTKVQKLVLLDLIASEKNPPVLRHTAKAFFKAKFSNV